MTHHSTNRSAMLLALVLVYQIAVTFAHPYKEYPFFFLLNTGNEGLDNTNTEQIRVTLPGGSVALRYPAFGYGDTIANVKVIGINLVKDLKVKIIDGGPGYNYVVLAVSGNCEVPYDVLVTLQTILNTVNAFDNAKATDKEISDPYSVILDRNDSAEETNDIEPPNNTKGTRMNAELAQPSSLVAPDYNIKDNVIATNKNGGNGYENYVDNYNKDEDNEFANEVNKNADDEDDDDEDDDPAYAPDIHRPTPEQFSDNPDASKENSGVSNQNSPDNNQQANDKYSEDYDDDDRIKVNNLFKPYETSHSMYENVVEQKDFNKYKQENENEIFEDDPNEIDQMFNDEEVHGKSTVNRNNNKYDTDDTSAVEY